MRTADFNFDLPEELIAQRALPRGESRLLVLERSEKRIRHLGVREFPAWLRPGDLVLLNDTRVIAARLEARRSTGRRFELLLLEQGVEGRWECLLRPTARVRAGEVLFLGDGGKVVPERNLGEGRWEILFDPPMAFDRLEGVGETPLPQYIHRPEGATPEDRERYQTIYAAAPGAVAAPTAGLHFDGKLVEAVRAAGAEVASLTLHVGIGTFRPVGVEKVADHRMHQERYVFSNETASAVNRALKEGRRIVCVGTTSVRALEGELASAGSGLVRTEWGSTDIFITPGFRFRGTGAMLTNFHLPKSTLLMMISAFAGREKVLDAYAEAIRLGYRFFSYGDAMLIV
ncbi:MAG: tRNA preQ1(34) S-adenosylmethionine ribosyltransferase-isomerase QueA [Thermoanaerobaculales bacterium]|nr:tRNA preQ1(34) S-adenosylmethionine ribosyltransferase-isomerase QueA [Thermoanaerobaculales bacterium]